MISEFINRIFIGIKKESAVLSKRWFYIPALFTIFLILLASRRWMQLVIPQVWDEDGTQSIPGFITHGWAFLSIPVNGYLITIPKLISAISLTISFSHYPIISTIISWIFIAAVGLAVILSPTRLKGKLFCAILIFLIPSDPEVFGLPLYTFWWAAILLLLVVLWDEKNKSLGWRLTFLLIGGLSSPIIVLILPILYLRAYLYRQSRSERVIAAIGTVIAFIQGYFIVKGSAGQFSPLASISKNVIPVFFGNFLIGNWIKTVSLLWISGGLIIFIILWFVKKKLNPISLILIYLLVGSIALTIARVNPAILHPMLAGPRYFFFSFILLFWILIQSYYISSSRTGRIFIGIIITIAAFNALPAWSRRHDDLHWADHVRSCRLFPNYTIPIQFNGDMSLAWPLELSGNNCANLLNKEFLASDDKDNKKPTYPYSAKKITSDKDVPSQILNSSVKVLNFQKPNSVGDKNLTKNTSETDDINIKLNRGDSILYRSDPKKDGQNITIVGHEVEYLTDLPSLSGWILLDFSNIRLPESFVAEIKI